MRTRDCHLFCASMHQHVPYGTNQDLITREWLWTLEWVFLHERMPYGQICSVPRHTWRYQMEDRTTPLLHIYINCYKVGVELSGWKGSVTYGLGADISLPPCPTSSGMKGFWNPSHKSDPRAEISGEIVWYDALAPRPEVLLSWCFLWACAVSLNWICYDMPGTKMSRYRVN